MRKEYKEIKERLLNDYNIATVSIRRNRIFIESRQDEQYLCFKDVFQNFLDECDNIFIIDKEFKIVGYEHYNTQIFNLTLKEVC